MRRFDRGNLFTKIGTLPLIQCGLINVQKLLVTWTKEFEVKLEKYFQKIPLVRRQAILSERRAISFHILENASNKSELQDLKKRIHLVFFWLIDLFQTFVFSRMPQINQSCEKRIHLAFLLISACLLFVDWLIYFRHLHSFKWRK